MKELSASEIEMVSGGYLLPTGNPILLQFSIRQVANESGASVSAVRSSVSSARSYFRTHSQSQYYKLPIDQQLGMAHGLIALANAGYVYG